MTKVYCLNWYVNAYDQEGPVTEKIFSRMPSFHEVKEACRGHHALSSDAQFGQLSRGENVDVRGAGDWSIDEEELL